MSYLRKTWVLIITTIAKQLYKLSVLNCGKGFISQYKYEQIKLKVLSHNPKFVFIQEVDISKDELVKYEKDIEIPGYKIVPSSIAYSEKT